MVREAGELKEKDRTKWSEKGWKNLSGILCLPKARHCGVHSTLCFTMQCPKASKRKKNTHTHTFRSQAFASQTKYFRCEIESLIWISSPLFFFSFKFYSFAFPKLPCPIIFSTKKKKKKKKENSKKEEAKINYNNKLKSQLTEQTRKIINTKETKKERRKEEQRHRKSSGTFFQTQKESPKSSQPPFPLLSVYAYFFIFHPL